MADTGPPIALMAFGLVLWLAVNATLAGISIQTVGVILFVAGAVWLTVELVQSRRFAGRRRAPVAPDEPVMREREIY
jgi:tetrahydromethanopterin S-methyltransferase subunit E